MTAIKGWRIIAILLISLFYFYVPVADYFYAKNNNLSVYGGFVGWLLISPIYIGIVLLLVFYRRKKEPKDEKG